MTRPAPRLVASDLDGTLVRTDQTVSDRTRAALARVEEAGSVLVLVTGRPPRWMAPVVEATGHRGLAVCANGALVYDLHTERVVRSHLLDADAAAEVVAALRRDVPGITFAVEKGPVDGVPGGFGREDVYVPRWDVDGVEVAPVEELFAAGAVKLLARHEQMGSDELLAAARQSLGALVEATHSSTDGLLEISASGISKASGLASLADDAGIDAAEVVAFGDMPNDLPMLTWAGHAIAMGNAHDEVKAIADEVTASNDDDGVAVVLERLFP
ncbi:MAG TPA: Cof-type HAD-IIB family hydrolase [Mycobacteriales bacterium]|nr:Cof-type HAD-IIB family hydrolase [Mycobacteriales bacterium]